MKAAEYSAEYVQRVKAGEDAICVESDMVTRFLSEAKGIASLRHARSNMAFEAIFRELQTKWFAFCDRVAEQLPEGQGPSRISFRVILQTGMPKIYETLREIAEARGDPDILMESQKGRR